MGARLRGLIVVVVVLVVGAFAGSALAQWWTAPAAPRLTGSPAAVGVPAGVRIRVEVLNSGGRGGMARSATGELRDGGFDVVYFGNGSARDSSVVLARTDDVAAARLVADALGIRSVVAEPDSNLYLDVTVVLGQEWEPAVIPDPQTDDAAPWWDLRRFIPERPGPTRPGTGRWVDPGTDDGG
ncbi:MAG: LytR C-terminal domain-containing protein [Gemmatimonadetes bacterium]|nr:LytR C-terminal domain-containing protein [Gemmatimonadota bacterium]